MANPLALMPIPITQWFDADGAPLAGGVLRFYTAGSTTPRAVYTDSTGGTELGTSVTLDAAGRSAAIYLGLDGYKVTLEDATGTLIWTQDEVETVAETLLAALGTVLATGTQDVTSGYVIVATDWFVTVDSTGGSNPCLIYLPAVASRSAPVSIKNVGDVPLSIIPAGADQIEGLQAAYAMPAAASPVFPTITLVNDGTSWWIASSHGLGV